MTKKETFEVIKTYVADNADLVAFCDKQIEVLSRKRAKSTAPTKKQVENEAIKARIAEVLTDEGKTVTAILGELHDETLTNQRVSALLRQMKDAGVATKEVVKGKALFTIA